APPQRTAEEGAVVFRVLLRETLGEATIVGMRPTPATRRRADLDGKREQAAPRLETLAARRPLHEPHDRAQHVIRRREISLVHAHLVRAKAHHHIAIPGEHALRDPAQSVLAQRPEKLVRTAWRHAPHERELRG